MSKPLSTTLGLSLGLALLAAMPAAAKSREAQARASALQAVVDCRANTDPSARLACYDAAVGTLDQAEKSGDVVVVDRAQARAVRRQAFGFDIASLSIFTRGEREADVNQILDTVTAARQGGDGHWTLTLESGAIWRQVDGDSLPMDPHAGSKAKIRKASMGSYLVSIDGQRALRMERVK